VNATCAGPQKDYRINIDADLRLGAVIPGSLDERNNCVAAAHHIAIVGVQLSLFSPLLSDGLEISGVERLHVIVCGCADG
jgi:hypothetical protein